MQQPIARWHGGFEDLRQRHDGRSRGSTVVLITLEGSTMVEQSWRHSGTTAKACDLGSVGSDEDAWAQR
ncbi:hypothetical protein PanWU01x14_045530 [Parasponia andersonii]|uniref:Uncharacterized protein n=1 Tax=Parasponia andersonii TaxID=3476 RepID=A0A2P5DPI8_PARAD|nr:hypothetical protein PanWU01x14_045530 [Parasponia andersonii]